MQRDDVTTYNILTTGNSFLSIDLVCTVWGCDAPPRFVSRFGAVEVCGTCPVGLVNCPIIPEVEDEGHIYIGSIQETNWKLGTTDWSYLLVITKIH